jgi:hypothetical protein
MEDGNMDQHHTRQEKGHVDLNREHVNPITVNDSDNPQPNFI